MAQAEPQRILIAEDEPFIVESLTFLLRRKGFAVRAVGDGLSVPGAIDAWSPHLLVLDVMLPELNGFDVLRRVRDHPAGLNMPVVVLTAKGQAADRIRMAELGADDFITKPFSNDDLLQRIAGLLSDDRRRSGEPAQAAQAAQPS
jgi:DNA-binding response OmpR family regulator